MTWVETGVVSSCVRQNLHKRISCQLPLKGRLLHIELFNLFSAQLQLGVQGLGLLQVLGQVIHVSVRVEVVNLELNARPFINDVTQGGEVHKAK